MTTEEASGLFDTHKQFNASIQRLPLFPQVINIDRNRTETNPEGITIERSTRDWATGLRSDKGQLLQCDAENGGKDKKAYLLVPTAYLAQVKTEYEKYKHRLQRRGQHHNSNNNTDHTTNTTDRPQEIYVPTAAVLRNYRFMQTMSAESIWKAAPPSVRPRPTSGTAPLLSENFSQATINKDHQHHRQHESSNDARTKKSTTIPTPKKANPGSTSRTTFSDKATTVCTTQSPLTRNTHTQSTISALEDTIQRQQTEIRNMLHRFDAMDTKMEQLTTAIKSGEQTQNNTIIQIQQQLDKVCSSLTFLVQQSTKNSLPPIPPTNHDAPTTSLPTSREPSTSVNAPPTTTITMAANTQTRSRSPTSKSPEKKKHRSTDRQETHPRTGNDTKNDDSNNKADQSEAQYQSPSSSDTPHPS
jgi:hypothetical protein